MKKFLFFGLGAVLVLCVSIFATSSCADADVGKNMKAVRAKAIIFLILIDESS